MNTRSMMLCGMLAAFTTASALAQEVVGPRVRIEADTGPVTVVSKQPPIANAADYRVKVADLDTNGDGVLRKNEVPASHALHSEFRLVDTDRNGRVTDEELANWK